jgi:hypothetical protein
VESESGEGTKRYSAMKSADPKVKSPRSGSPAASARLNASARLVYMRLNPENMHYDYYISSPMEKPATKYFNPRHFQIQRFMERCDMVLIVEHCSLCDTHTHLLRHDGRKYEHEANKCLQQLSKILHDGKFNIRLGVVKVPVLPLDYTVGCFEVSLIYQNRAGQYYNKLLYSKRQKKTWPSAEDLEGKLEEFIRNAKLTSNQPTTTAYAGQEIGGISKAPYPAGGFGPWDATPFGRSPVLLYPTTHTLLAAQISEGEVLYLYDSRLNDAAAVAPTSGTLVWVRSLPSAAPVAGALPERHAQVGVVESTLMSPRNVPSPSPKSLTPRRAQGQSSSQKSNSAVAMVQVRLKYDPFATAITVPASQCMSDAEHINRSPLQQDQIPMELETLFLLAYLYRSRLPRNTADFGAVMESMKQLPQYQQDGELVESLYWGWKLLSPNSDKVVANESKILLSRLSLYHGLRELVSNVESFLLAEGKINAENNYCVCHRNTGQRIDLQLAYSEPILDWICSKFGTLPAMAPVNVIDMHVHVLANYNANQQQRPISVEPAGNPNTYGFDRNTNDSPVCGISGPEINVDINRLLRTYYDKYITSINPAIAKLNSTENAVELVAALAPVFRFVVCQVCCEIHLSAIHPNGANTNSNFGDASHGYSEEFIMNMHNNGELMKALALMLSVLVAGGSSRQYQFQDQNAMLKINQSMCPIELMEHLLMNWLVRPDVATALSKHGKIRQVAHLLRCSVGKQVINMRVIDWVLMCLCPILDLQATGSIRLEDLSKGLAFDYFTSRPIGALWSLFRSTLLGTAGNKEPLPSSRSFKALVEALVSEGVSAYLQHHAEELFAENATNMSLPDGWALNVNDVGIASESFSAAVTASMQSQGGEQSAVTVADIEKIVSVFAAAQQKVTYESLSFDGDAASNAAAMKLSAMLTQTTRGSTDVVLVHWYYFLRWLAVTDTSNGNAETELDRTICGIAAQIFSVKGTPLQAVGTPLLRTASANAKRATSPSHFHHRPPHHPSPAIGDDDGGSVYAGEGWDNESQAMQMLMNSNAPSPEPGSHPHRHHHHEHHGHSGYSNYEGDSIGNENDSLFDGDGSGSVHYYPTQHQAQFQYTHEYANTDDDTMDMANGEASQGHPYQPGQPRPMNRPGSPTGAPVIASLEDLIMSIDDHINEGNERRSQTKEMLTRGNVPQSSNASVLSVDKPSQRAKSAAGASSRPTASTSVRRTSSTGVPNSARPATADAAKFFPKEITVNKLEMYGAPLRALIDASFAQDKQVPAGSEPPKGPQLSLSVEISADAVCLVGKVDVNSSNRDSGILTFDMKDADVGEESADMMNPSMDLRHVPSILIKVKATRSKQIVTKSIVKKPVTVAQNAASQQELKTQPAAKVTVAAAKQQPSEAKPIPQKKTPKKKAVEEGGDGDDDLFDALVAEAVNGGGSVDSAKAGSIEDDDIANLLGDNSPDSPANNARASSPDMLGMSSDNFSSSPAAESSPMYDHKSGGTVSPVKPAPAAIVMEETEVVSVRYERGQPEEVFKAVALSSSRFLEIRDDEFRLDFAVAVTLLVSAGLPASPSSEMDTLHISISGTSKDFDSVARQRWSEARTPHYALMARLPPNVNAVIHPGSTRRSNNRLSTASNSLLTPWFPAAINNQKEPGKTSLAEFRPLSPTWHPNAINNRDPFSDGRAWSYDHEMRLRQANGKRHKQPYESHDYSEHFEKLRQQLIQDQLKLQETQKKLKHLKTQQQQLRARSPDAGFKTDGGSPGIDVAGIYSVEKLSPTRNTKILDEVDSHVHIYGPKFSPLKEEDPIRPISSGKNMQAIFLQRNKYSGGESRERPPLPARKPPVPHFDFVKSPDKSDETEEEPDDVPFDAFVPPPRRAATPKASDFPKIKFSHQSENLTDGPYYRHNRFPKVTSSYTALLGSAVPRWPEVKQGSGNTPKPRVLPPNIRLRDSGTYYKLYGPKSTII